MKNPPNFDPEVDDYVSWKADVTIWKMYTDTAQEKVGPAVYLSLQGKARDVVRNLDPNLIGAATGYKTITDELDKVYLSNESSRAFVAFKDLYEYRREGGQDWKAFIVEFEKRYHKVKTSLIGELSSGVQAFFLLMSANLPSESEKLARATANLDYTDMRDN